MTVINNEKIDKTSIFTFSLRIIILGLLYYSVTYLENSLLGASSSQIFWIGGALAYAAILSWGSVSALGLLLGAMFFYLPNSSFLYAFIQALSGTFALLSGAVIVRYYAKGKLLFESVHNSITFFIGTFIAAAVLLLTQIAFETLHVNVIGRSIPLMFSIYFSSLLVLTPFIYIMLQKKEKIELFKKLPEKGLLTLFVLGLTYIFFSPTFSFNTNLEGTYYALFLPLIWAASRFNSLGGTFTLLVIGSFILSSMTLQNGPFVQESSQHIAYIFCIVGAMMVLIVSPKREKFVEKEVPSESVLSIKALTNAIPLPVFYKDENGFYAGHNKNFDTLIGSSKKDALETLMSLPNDTFEVLGVPFDNGIVKEVQVTTSSHYDANKKLLGIIGIINDISELENTRKVMKEWKERYELALEGAEDGLWDWDIKEDKVFYSRKWKEIMGYSEHESPDSLDNWLNLVHSQSMATLNEAIRSHLDGRTSLLNTEFRIKSEQPFPIWVSVHAKVHRDSSGKATRMVGYVTDVSEQKKAENELKETKELFTSFMKNFPANAFIKDTKGSYKYINQHFQRFLGMRYKEGSSDKDIFSPQTAKEIAENDRQTKYEGKNKHEQVMHDEVGKAHIFQMYQFCLDSTNEEVNLIGGIGIDITKERLYQERIHLYAKIFENTAEGIMVTDPNGQIMLVNKAYSEITGFSPKEVIGKNPSFRKSGRYSQKFYQAMWYALLNNGHWKGELFNMNKNGEITPELVSINAIRGNSGKIKHFVAVITSIMQQKQQESRLRHLAHFDTLTNLPNRFLFEDRLKQAITRTQRENSKIALFFIDLDDFKIVNDKYGQEAGNIVLNTVARRLRDAVRDTDTVARLSGDEFTIIAEHIKDVDDIPTISNKITLLLSKPIMYEDKHIEITASIGISVCPDHGRTERDLLRHADHAMYQVKKDGKNSVAYYQG